MDPADRLLSQTEFVAFDLETTGLSPVACRIVEFGAVRFRLGAEELDRLEQLVDPQCPIPVDAMRIHGIRDDMVRGKPTVGEILPRFFDFLGPPETILLAHNARFDLGFLSFAALKLHLPLPPHCVLDTLALSRVCLPQLFSHRLETVAIYLGVARREDHRALSDARMAAAVFEKLVCDRGLRTVRDLFRLSSPCGFGDTGDSPVAPPPGYEGLAVAIEKRQTIVMLYEGGTKGPMPRRVSPRALIQSGGRPYLTAYCHFDCTEKTYRLDRIREFRVEP